MKSFNKLLSALLLCILCMSNNIVFGATRAEPLFNKADYLPNDTEAQIEANSMKWFEERVKYVKENIKMLPDDFMEDWSWDKPLTRMEFLVLMTPVRSDKELLFGNYTCHFKDWLSRDLKNPWLDDSWSGITRHNCASLTINDNATYTGNKEDYKRYYGYATVNKATMQGDLIPEQRFEWVLHLINTKYAHHNIIIPEHIDTYEKLKNYSYKRNDNGLLSDLLMDIQLGDSSPKTFRPDDYINLAEASKATLNSYYQEDDSFPIELDMRGIRFERMNLTEKLVHYRNTAQTNTNWYTPYIQIQKEIQGLDKNTTLKPSDTPNTKQIAQMMFQVIIHPETEWEEEHGYNNDQCFGNWEGICE